MGRPSKYKPGLCDDAIKLGAEGKGVCEISRDLGITRMTMFNWRRDIPEFDEAMTEALWLSQAWWEERGRLATFGAYEGFSATSYIYQMKNRFRADWRDSSEVHNSGTMQLTVLTGVPRDDANG